MEKLFKIYLIYYLTYIVFENIIQVMTDKNAIKYWSYYYDQAKDYNDKKWDDDKRHEHKMYVEAMKAAIDALNAVETLKWHDMVADPSDTPIINCQDDWFEKILTQDATGRFSLKDAWEVRNPPGAPPCFAKWQNVNVFAEVANS